VKKAQRQNPSFPVVYRCLASAFAHLGRDAEAREAVARMLEADPGFSISRLIGQSNAKLFIEGADSGDVARSFRDHVARCSDMMSPAWASCWYLVFDVKRAAGQSFAAGHGRVRRRLSPARSMRWALWTSRSRMASA
jgi:hypothetical protein